jgi:hypothetical protein
MGKHNDITGDKIATKNSTDEFRNGWDRIFGERKPLNESLDPLDLEPAAQPTVKPSQYPAQDEGNTPD